MSGAGLALGPWQGHYQIVRALGRGGMGEAWLGFDERLRRPVVVKVIRRDIHDPRIQARFEREVRAVAEMDHPNIARLFDSGTDAEGRTYFTMEYVEGVTLDRVVLGARQRGRGLSLGAVVSVGGQACAALSKLHAAGLVHRDVSPQNLVVRPDGTVKLLDFGVARGDGLPALTQAGELVGKPSYISPEQARGEAVGPHTDLFALGAVLFELATGSWLRSRLPREALAQVEDPDFALRKLAGADVAAGLRAVLEGLLTPDVGARFAHADDVLDRLNELGPSRGTDHGRRILAAELSEVVATALARAEAEAAEGLAALAETVDGVPSSTPLAASRRRARAPGPKGANASSARWVAGICAVGALAFFVAMRTGPRRPDALSEPAGGAPQASLPTPGATSIEAARQDTLAVHPSTERQEQPRLPSKPSRKPTRAKSEPSPADAPPLAPLDRALRAVHSNEYATALRLLQGQLDALDPSVRDAVSACIEDARFLSMERPRLEPCIERARRGHD